MEGGGWRVDKTYTVVCAFALFATSEPLAVDLVTHTSLTTDLARPVRDGQHGQS